MLSLGKESTLSIAMRHSLSFFTWPTVLCTTRMYTSGRYMQRVSYITDPARQIYAAMVVALDDGVGQVVQTLQANTFWITP